MGGVGWWRRGGVVQTSRGMGWGRPSKGVLVGGGDGQARGPRWAARRLGQTRHASCSPMTDARQVRRRLLGHVGELAAAEMGFGFGAPLSPCAGGVAPICSPHRARMASASVAPFGFCRCERTAIAGGKTRGSRVCSHARPEPTEFAIKELKVASPILRRTNSYYSRR